ncbi:FAD-binding oxidoreductase [Lentzea sp. NPDC058436]|uniref:FAD-binding oxidoreductase n=1 Tax=Lentzea sp. NPDC058436 TaxID=3346499 RepID=UPI0036590E88
MHSAGDPQNTLYAHRKPLAVVRCARVEDVQAGLERAARAGIPVAARSGGHSYAGYSWPDGGLVLDLAGLSDVRVNGRTATIGAGARMHDIYEALGAAGQALPAGTCRSVGIGGLALGGGIGVTARKYGLTCDHLVDARIVTPDGVLRTASEEPDLLWALKGGGGGNFGVVTEFTFRTDPAPDLTVFGLDYPEGTADVVDAWQEWIADAPDELWTSLRVDSGPKSVPSVRGAYVGAAKDLHRLLDRMPPAEREVEEMTYLQAMRHYAGPAETGEPYVASSRMLHAPVPGSKVAALMDGRPPCMIQFDSFGGAIERVAPDATAFPHRDATASAQVYVLLGDLTEARARALLAGIRDGLGAGTTGYVNYIDPEMPDWPTAYYGRNLVRLKEVADRYDPDRVLAFPQGL